MLALALTKYDINGAPSNWELRYAHENVIFQWARDTLNREGALKDPASYNRILDADPLEEELGEELSPNEAKDHHIGEVDKLISSYEKGFIPDAFDQLLDFFT